MGESDRHTEIRYAVSGPVAMVTLRRPNRLNAVTATMANELIDAFDAADTDAWWS